MKTLLLFILFTSTMAFTKEYFAYPKNNKELLYLEQNFQALSIFTKKEKSFLTDTRLKQALRFSAPENQLKLIQNNCKTCQIEENISAQRFNAYSSYQWSIHNTGKLFKRWISDIDVTYVQGLKDEDLQTQGISETLKKENKIKIAIIDSGVDLNHPDLQGQFYEDALECEDLKKYNQCLKVSNNRKVCHKKYSQIDHNKNGYPLDCNGWNITGASNPKSGITGNGNISDKDGHGTHIAGIIGAKDNEIGVKGIIQNVEILPVQVGVASQNKTDSELPTDNIAKGILYAIKSKAQIINLSLGWRINQDSLLMRKMIKLAIDKNILVVAAAGNDAHDETVYPCSYKGVICVASHDVNGELSSFSNFGAHVDILAPGNNILSTYPTTKRSRSFTEDSNYEYLSGTSQAAPQVSGLLGRLLEKGFTPKEAKAKLLNGSRQKRETHKWIRNGNASLKKSLAAKKDYSYIVTKSPALINISKNKEFKFKLNVFEETNVSIKASGLSFSKDTWSLTSINKDIELSSSINNEDLFKKSYFITVNLESKNFQKSFTLQVNPIMVISKSTKSEHIKSSRLMYKRAFSPDTVKAFNNFFDNKTDYLALKENNNRYFAQGVLKDENSYTSTTPIILSDKKSIVINISKVDIDLDSKPNYVITAVDLSSKSRKTFFTVLDENFSESKEKITPTNEYKNNLTTLPGTFYWSRVDKRMLPTWIGFGKNPSYEQSSPWESETDEELSYRIYQLHPTKGLITKKLEQEKYPISFLYPSNSDKRNGILYFTVANSFGYKKEYEIYKLKENKIKKHASIKTKFYFDIINMANLPLANSDKANTFYSMPSSNGSQRVLAIEITKDGLLTKEALLRTKIDGNDILRVLRFDLNGNAIAQTSKKLLIYSNNKILSRQSYTNAKRIKHYLLNKSIGVILPQSETFNLSSHTLLVSPINNEVVEPAHLQSYGADGCIEIGIEQSKNLEFLSYYCERNKRIIKLRVSL